MLADLIVKNAAQIVTCASGGKPKRGAQMLDAGIIENAALAIANGKIAGVGTGEQIARDFQSQNVIDAVGKTVAPGFVDCHTHIVFAGNRLDEFELKIKGADYLEILQNGGGIISTVEKTRNASAAELIEQTMKRLDAMLRCGTTTAEIKTGYGLDGETEFKMLEAIFELNDLHKIDLIPTFLAAHAVPIEFKNNANAYVDLICSEMLPRLAKIKDQKSMLKAQFFVDVFCERNAFDLAQSRRILETARSFGFGLKAHVDEFTNLGGAKMAIELGAVSIDHLDKTSEEEIELLAKSDTIAVVTPAVNFNFGSDEFADARKLIDENCALAVSTDYNPGSAPCPSLPTAMAIACRYQKLLPAEAFNAATVNAAFAVGLGAEIGSLETGKQADVLIFDTADYRNVVYEFGGNFVETVIKNGEIVFDSKS